MKTSKWISKALPVLMLCSLANAEPPKRVLMGVLGDSISAGTLSDIPLPFPKDLSAESLSNWFLRVFGPILDLQNKKANSWASGEKIDSHFVMLQRYMKSVGDPRHLDVMNVSVPGNETSDLVNQARQLVRAMSSGKYDSLRYVTLLIGANDVCTKNPPRGSLPFNMRMNIFRALRLLSKIRQAEPIRILIVGIPPIPDLGRDEIRNSHTLFGISCSVFRDDILGFCPNLLTWRTEDEYHSGMEIVERTNDLLRSIAAEASSVLPNMEVAYSGSLQRLRITAPYLAVDCFHPAKVAQEVIAQETWTDQPWFY